MRFNVRAVTIVALAAFAFGAIVMAACNSSDNGDDAQAADQAALDAVKDQATRAQVLAAATVFRVEGMHELDTAISKATEIDPAWEGKVTRMRRATAGVAWPDEMKDHATELEAALQGLEDAIQAEDMGNIKTYAPEAHGAWHELDGMAYPYIAGEAGGTHEPSASDANGHGEQNSPSATQMVH